MSAPKAAMQHFEDFWPYYLEQHRNRTCRRLHFIGTSLGAGLGIYAIVSHSWVFGLVAVFAGYGFAWVGHFFFERNRPATFRYPFWSLRGDFRMYARMLARRNQP